MAQNVLTENMLQKTALDVMKRKRGRKGGFFFGEKDVLPIKTRSRNSSFCKKKLPWSKDGETPSLGRTKGGDQLVSGRKGRGITGSGRKSRR